MLAIFLAPGELTYCLRLGFLRYPQRHGFCSLTFWQQVLDGGAVEVIAPMHGLSSAGLQFTASAVYGISARSIAIISTITANTATPETFFIILILSVFDFKNNNIIISLISWLRYLRLILLIFAFKMRSRSAL